MSILLDTDNELLKFTKQHRLRRVGQVPNRTGWFWSAEQQCLEYWDLDIMQQVFVLRCRVSGEKVGPMSTREMRKYCSDQLDKCAGKPPLDHLDKDNRPKIQKSEKPGN